MPTTVDKLLDAAETRIRSGGFHAVSFRDLADDLGIKSASVHYHFRQKEDLGVAVVERYAARFFAALDQMTVDAANADDRLRAFCTVYRSAFVSADQICLCGVLGAEAFGLPDRVAAAVKAFLAANIDWLTRVFDDAGTPARDRACLVVASLQGAMMIANTTRDITVLDRVIDQITAL